MPPDSSLPTAGDARDWLSLGPASRLLGVDPDTLRRWADAGKVDAWATPGGHRRFSRRSLERLASGRRPTRMSLTGLGATTARLSRAYRRSYAEPATDGRPPASELDGDREAFRADGRRLVAALLAHLDARTAAARDRAEAEAGAVTDELARRLSAAGTPLGDAVTMFVIARKPFLSELSALGRRRTLDPTRLAAAYDDASALLDRLLLRLIAAYERGSTR